MSSDEAPLSQERLDELTSIDEAATEPPWWFDEDELVWRLHGTAGWTPTMAEGRIPAQPINHQILKAPKKNTSYMEYWPNEADGRFLTDGRRGFRELLQAVRWYRRMLESDATVQRVVELKLELDAAYSLLEEYRQWAVCAPERE